MDKVTCSKCGTTSPSEPEEGTPRPPCATCGGTSWIVDVSIMEVLAVGDHMGGELIPADQDRDWKQRWKRTQDELHSVLRSHTESMSSDAIHAALQRLFSFLISTYHLKDALTAAAPQTGVKASDVEDAVTLDSRLALLADLANLDKHMKLSRPPRSGTVPAIGKVSGVDRNSGGGWQISLQIVHGVRVLDGLTVAEDAVNAWREKLLAWGLI